MIYSLLNQLWEKLFRYGSKDVSNWDEAFIVIPVQKIIEQALPRIEDRLSKHQIAVRLQISPEDLSIECKEQQLIQALFHMLKNSCDAVAVQAEKWIEIQVIENQDCVEFSIVDSSPNTRFVFTVPIYQSKPMAA